MHESVLECVSIKFLMSVGTLSATNKDIPCNSDSFFAMCGRWCALTLPCPPEVDMAAVVADLVDLADATVLVERAVVGWVDRAVVGWGER